MGKVAAFRAAKGREKLACLTAYDYATARLLDEEGVDLLLVGDSLGMVVLGFADTTFVTLDQMVHHTAAVGRAQPRALVVADLPFGTYREGEGALASARRLLEVGAEAVKLEGGGPPQVEVVRRLRSEGVEVMGHLGMLPQSIREEGGYKKKGRGEREALRLVREAQELEAAGCFALVLEGVVEEVAREMTRAVGIPTIGIGSGQDSCDGEVAVVTDLIGSFPWFVPPFARPQAAVAELIQEAVRRYQAEVRGEGG